MTDRPTDRLNAKIITNFRMETRILLCIQISTKMNYRHTYKMLAIILVWVGHFQICKEYLIAPFQINSPELFLFQ